MNGANGSAKNLLLEALAPEAKKLLAGELEPIALPLGSVLFEADSYPRYVHFLTSGIASIVTTMADGDGVEVGLTGAEGLPEKIHLLGPLTGMTRCFMQVGGTALRMDFGKFQRIFCENQSVHAAVLRCVQAEALQLSQLCACNRLHDVEERLARWLLMMQARTGEAQARVTQELLAEMLGARRSTINLAAGSLQRAGIIEFRRSNIRIANREMLEDVACECYPIIRKLIENMYRDVPTPHGAPDPAKRVRRAGEPGISW